MRVNLGILATVSIVGLFPLVADAMDVTITSPNSGFLITEEQEVSLRVLVSGAGESVDIAWSVSETEGAWRQTGRKSLSTEDGNAALSLAPRLPGRGHYTLRVRAVSGEAVAEAEKTLGIVFTPRPPRADAPWGIFHIPQSTPDPRDPLGAETIARSMRLLGASWARLNFWNQAYDGIAFERRDGRVEVKLDTDRWKAYARALRGEGIHIMGEIAQCPTQLSSRPEERGTRLDMGPVVNRVPPRDYAEWDALMTALASAFRDEIEVWEIWNEPGYDEGFWVGTPEAFAELVRHTSAALRRGNPEARIACSGFVDAWDFADRLLELGIGEYMDILSVHYTDHQPDGIARWQALLDKHGLDIPIWNTEERAEVPLENLAAGMPVSFKFLHVGIGYEAFRPLVNTDFTPRPAALWFATGAHCLGEATFERRLDDIPDYDGYLFRRGDEQVAAFSVQPFHNLFAPQTVTHVDLAVEPLESGTPVRLTDRYGRSEPLAVKDGTARATLDSSLMFINGARRVALLGAREGEPTDTGTYLFEAEDGRLLGRWHVEHDAGFSGGAYASIWSDDEPGDAGHAVEVPVTVPMDGRYAVYFVGNRLTRLEAPRSLSSFNWSFDSREPNLVDSRIEGEPDVMNAGEGLFRLGEAELSGGKHVFRLKLAQRRTSPDTRFALWFDAVVLRKLAGERDLSRP